MKPAAVVIASAICCMPSMLLAQQSVANTQQPRKTEALISLTDELRTALQSGDLQNASHLVAELASGIIRARDASRPSPKDEFAALEVDASGKTLSGRFIMLGELARSAFAADELDKATAYANELLADAESFRRHPFYGDAVHTGNQILGRVAVRRNDVAGAKIALLASAKTSGSSFLSRFGPDFNLAKDLLARGERDAVLEYLTLCAGFWKNDGGLLNQWAATIRGGAIPDFSASPRRGIPY